ncbi:hypothetical protein HYH03_011165 [Edaphochlamys debaryana]|uniref:Cation/H+ exchanger transmembrane domain-containing protein n=1 Tax=Edaphochlamys debaryana TaxID=47281 RepID=A0A836BWP5_9CHLO|nr:hypothetical protein HYH03_011165 [Edaphochlamys debaryana]|eukprot:KAG2490363.1 hypothetical protein HYH03_011165 [Edaphochlamys debaryana]
MADVGVCANANVTYDHRVDNPDNYNWCFVPDSAYDAVLFAGVALLVACVVSGRLSAVWVLVAGALCELASFQTNLGRFGNSVALWVGGIHPGEVFFYAFLPPLLLDSAARVDYFVFKKVLVLSLVFAFVLVCTGTLLAVPLMLWGLGLGPRYGWGWADVALFNAMLASTDAVAVTSVLRAGGAPELLGALLEGESLFNDASGIVLFDIFLRKVIQARKTRNDLNPADAAAASGPSIGRSLVSGVAATGGGAGIWASKAHHLPPDLPPHSPLHHHSPPNPAPHAGPGQAPPGPDPHHGWPWPWPWPFPEPPEWLAELVPELWAVAREFAWLVAGGIGVGMAFGFMMQWALKLLQWRRLKPHVEVSLTFAAGYLAFYVANAYLQASGVIAVVVFGVYGAATGTWGLSSQARRAGAFDRFWDVLSFCVNGLIFFLLGASSVNYMVRLGAELDPSIGGRDGWGGRLYGNVTGPYGSQAGAGSAGAGGGGGVASFVGGLCEGLFGEGWSGTGRPQWLLLETILLLPVVYVTLFAMRGTLIFAFCSIARAIKQRKLCRLAMDAAKAAAAPKALNLPPNATHEGGSPLDHSSHHHRSQPPGQTGGPSLTAAAGQRSTPVSEAERKQRAAQHAREVAATEAALHATPDWRGMIFATVGGLRGAVSLIMAQIVLAAINAGGTEAGGEEAERRDKEVTAQMVVWTAGFVLMSLVVNAPLLTPLMRWLHLNTISPIKLQVRARAKAALRRFTATTLAEMRAAAELADGADGSGGFDMSLMLLRGVDWAAVEKTVDMSRKLEAVFPGARPADAKAAAAPNQVPPVAEAAAGSGTGGGAAPQPGMKRSKSLKRVQSRKTLMSDADDLAALIGGGSSSAGGGGGGSGGGEVSLRQPLLSPSQRRSEEGDAGGGGGGGGGSGLVGGGHIISDGAIAAATSAAAAFTAAGEAHAHAHARGPAGGVATAFGRPGAADAALAAIAAAGGTAGGTAAAAAAAASATPHMHKTPSTTRVSFAPSVGLDGAAAPPPSARDIEAGGGGGGGGSGGLAAAATDGGSARTSRVSSSGAAGAAESAGGAGALATFRRAASKLLDKSRNRLLDEQFAAWQMGGDEGGMGMECPFASYAGGGPTPSAASTAAAASHARDSTAGSTAASTTPRVSYGGPSGHLGAVQRTSTTREAPMGLSGAGVSPMPSGLSPSLGLSPDPTAPRTGGVTPAASILQPPDTAETLRLHGSSGDGNGGILAGAATSASTEIHGVPISGADHADAQHVPDDVSDQVPDLEGSLRGGCAFAFAGHMGLTGGGKVTKDDHDWYEEHYGTGVDGLYHDWSDEEDEHHRGRHGKKSSKSRKQKNVDSTWYDEEYGTGVEGLYHDFLDDEDEQYAGDEERDEQDGSYLAPSAPVAIGGSGSGSSRMAGVAAAAALETLHEVEHEHDDEDQPSSANDHTPPNGAAGGSGRRAAAVSGVDDSEAAATPSDASDSGGVSGPGGGDGDSAAVAADGGEWHRASSAPELHTDADGAVDAASIDGGGAAAGPSDASTGSIAAAAAAAVAAAASRGRMTSPFFSAAGSASMGSTDAALVSVPSGGQLAAGRRSDSGGAAGGAGIGAAAGRRSGRQLGNATGRGSKRRPAPVRMSPSFAIGAATVADSPDSRAAAAHGLTRHLSLNRAARAAAAATGAHHTGHSVSFSGQEGIPGAAGSPGFGSMPSPAASTHSLPGSALNAAAWRLGRQPSSRWISVSHAESGPLPGSGPGSAPGPGPGPSALAAALGRGGPGGRSMGTGRGLAGMGMGMGMGMGLGAGRGGLAGALGGAQGGGVGGGLDSGNGSGTAGTGTPVAKRSWASLQDLAGQQRTLDAFGPLEGGLVSGPNSVAGSVVGAVAGSSKAAASEELLVEYRIRLLAGFKRFFHEQTLEGVLSPSGMRLLCFCCDEALHHPSAPLDLWGTAEREVVGRGAVQWQAWAHLALRRGIQRLMRGGAWLPAPIKALAIQPLKLMADLLSSALSRVMLVGLEVAVELAAALSDSSPQLQWLRYAGPAGATIWEEVQAQAEGVRRFILDRVIEAPDRFQATQSHRASLALLRQQVAFVRSMLKTGLVDADEAEALLEPIERRIWRLEARGPRWTQPTLTQVLATCALLRGVPPGGMDWLRAAGDLRPCSRGADLGALLAGGGLFIVVLGTVQVSLVPVAPDHPPTPNPGPPGPDGNPAPLAPAPPPPPPRFYVGVGGVVGVSTALIGRAVPGMAVASAVAEGNALGKGPVVFALSSAAIAAVRSRAAAGHPEFQLLLLNMYRLVGGHICERQRTGLVAHIAALLTGAVAHAFRTGGRRRALRLRELLVRTGVASELRPNNAAPSATTSLRRKQKAVLDEVYDAPAAGLMTQRSGPGDASGRGRRSMDEGYEEDEEEEDDEEEDEEGDDDEEETDGLSSIYGGSSAAAAGDVACAVAAALAADEQLSRRCLERAAEMVEAVRQGVKAASLLVLQPGQSFVQRSTVVLVNGSLLQHVPQPPPQAQPSQQPTRQSSHATSDLPGPGGSIPDPRHASISQPPHLAPTPSGAAGGASEAGTAGATSAAVGGEPARGGLTRALSRNRSFQFQRQGSSGRISADGGGPKPASVAPVPVFKPPTLLLWLPDHCEPAVARVFRQCDAMRYAAGALGATVLVCGDSEGVVVYK